jgi:predicted phage tail protein
MTNPENFVSHRQALMGLSVQMPALTAALVLTKEKRYAARAADYPRAWLVDSKTRMNPNLQYAQAIHGRTTGRGTGGIDTIHLVEVVQALPFLARSGALTASELTAV